MNYYLYFSLILLVMSSVFIYGKLRCLYKENFIDILSIRFMKHIDGWILTHFIIYALTGIFFPETFFLSMIIGVLWEFIEIWIGRNKPKFLKGFGDCKYDNKQTNWWYGQIKDVYADFFGFIFGKYIILPLLI